jgi:hypothetical protein
MTDASAVIELGLATTLLDVRALWASFRAWLATTDLDEHSQLLEGIL